MSNHNYNGNENGNASNSVKHKERAESGRGKFTEKLPKWADLPGKGQPKDRSAGVKRAKVYPQSKGL